MRCAAGCLQPGPWVDPIEAVQRSMRADERLLDQVLRVGRRAREGSPHLQQDRDLRLDAGGEGLTPVGVAGFSGPCVSGVTSHLGMVCRARSVP